MLTLMTSVPEIGTHIFEPIMRQMVQKLIKEIGMVEVMGNHVYFNTDISGASVSTNENNNPTVRENRTTCTMRPNMHPENSKWEMATPSTFNGRYISYRDMEERDPVFWDPALGMTITEKCVPCTMTCECIMSFKENSHSYEAMSRMNRMYSNTEKIMLNNLAFDYKIPIQVYSTMYLIYKMNGGAPEGFVDYLKQYSINDIDVVTNRHKLQHKELTISKSAYNGLATIEMSQDRPTDEKIGQTATTYNIEFVITIQFERIDLLILKYPPVVKNVLVPESAVFVDPDKQWGDILAFHPLLDHEGYLRREMRYPQQYRGIVKSVNCVRFPWYDRWMIPNLSPLRRLGYKPFFISIILLDDIENENGITSIDLSAPLDEHRAFVPEVIQMLQRVKHMALFMEDFINVSVYANNTLVEPETLELTDGIHLTIPNRDINKVYRLVLSEHKGRKLVPQHALRVINFDIITHY